MVPRKRGDYLVAKRGCDDGRRRLIKAAMCGQKACNWCSGVVEHKVEQQLRWLHKGRSGYEKELWAQVVVAKQWQAQIGVG